MPDEIISNIKRAEPTEDDPMIVNPINGVQMEKLDIGGIKIDRCPKTGAIWLDRGELSRLALLDSKHKGLLKKLDQPMDGVAPRSRRGELKSPRTGATMMVCSDPNQKHIEFEVCPECGGCFFDAGELADLTEYSFGERLRSFFG